MGPTAANGHNLQGGLVGGKTEIILIISKVFWTGGTEKTFSTALFQK